MISINHFQQNRLAWHAAAAGCIGASGVSCLLTSNPVSFLTMLHGTRRFEATHPVQKFRTHHATHSFNTVFTLASYMPYPEYMNSRLHPQAVCL